MAASAEQNEIIELTDLIEKGPDLPKTAPKRLSPSLARRGPGNGRPGS